MAYGDMPTRNPGDTALSSDFNRHSSHIDDLDTRLDVIEGQNLNTRLGAGVTTGSTATDQLQALQALTGASGSTAAGNAALSARLGTGVTTSNTATAQLTSLDTRLGTGVTAASTATAQLNSLDGRLDTVETQLTGVGTNSDIATGNAGAQLGSLRTRVSALEGGGNAIPATAQGADGTRGTVTSTSYTATRTGATGEAGTTFVAHASGKAKVTWSVNIGSSPSWALCAFEVRSGGTVGSGTVVQAASDTIVCQNTAIAGDCTFSNFYLLTGLTAGGTYNIRLMYRVNGGTTGGFDRPKVLVEPVLA